MKFEEMFTNLFGKEETKLLLDSFDNPPYRGIRLNPKKSLNLDIFNDLEKHPFVKNAYIYEKQNQNYGKIPYHMMGMYYIQEPSAMLVGELLDVSKSDYVADLCAAPGGKSTHVGLKLDDDAFLLSNDINNKRALDLSENIERMGLKNTLVTSESIEKLSSIYIGFFDKIILDAPCSGEGMFRKNELSRQDWSMDKVNKCVEIQKSIILDAYKMLKYNGEMIYSTCTYNIYENEEMINYLLKNTNAELVDLPIIEGTIRGINLKEAIRLFPSHFKGEGHFICKIKCKDEHEINLKNKKSEPLSPTYIKIFNEFVKKNLNISFDNKRLFLNNEHLYYKPLGSFNSKNIHILRNGLYLGEFAKNRFEPSHSLALASKKEEWKNHINLNEEEVNKFIKGESFNKKGNQGYNLVLYDGFPIGYCKIVNDVLKNHFPKKYRIL